MVFKLNRTGSVLNRHERLNFNENWDNLEKIIRDRGLEILSESGFLTWLEKNGIKHRGEVATVSDLPSSDSLNTVRGVADDNKIYIKKENGWVPFQSIDISKINYVENKVDGIAVTIDNYPKNVPEADDGPRIQRGIDDLNARGGGTLMLPEQYTSSVTLIIKENVNLFGMHREFSTITFTNPVVGIKTDGRTDNFNIKHLTIQGKEAYLDTIGIHISNYSSYYQIEDMHIKRFGKWGIKADGGIKWTVREVDFWVTGRNSTIPEDSGSLFVDVGNDDYTLRSVQARIESCYARGGGEYALKLYRPTDIQVDGFIAEYHKRALFAENASGTVYNFYQEANTGPTDEIIHLHDSALTFIGGSRTADGYGGIKKTWSGVGFEQRFGIIMSAHDISLRTISAAKINLKNSTNVAGEKGDLRYNHTAEELETHNGNEWNGINNVYNGLTGPDLEKSFNLGKASQYTSFILEVTSIGESLATRRKYEKFVIHTFSGLNEFSFEKVENIGVETRNSSIELDSQNNIILTIPSFSVGSTRYGCKITNLYGKRYLKEI